MVYDYAGKSRCSQGLLKSEKKMVGQGGNYHLSKITEFKFGKKMLYIVL